MDTLRSDLRQALRFLLRRPLFSLVAVLSLAIGIGANAAIFTAVDALLLRAPGGVTGADRLVELGPTADGRGSIAFSHADYLDLREGAPPLESLAGYAMSTFSVGLGQGGERVMGMTVTGNYFSTLGVSPGLGRFFLPEEDREAGAHPVVVVSHRFWRDRLGADPAAVGRTVLVNRHPFTVVGVAPEAFRGHVAAIQPAVWVPASMAAVARPGADLLGDRRIQWLLLIGRLAPAATPAQADAALESVFRGLRERFPETHERRAAAVRPLSPIPAGGRAPVMAFLTVLLALSGVVLLVTCANLAGMLLARAASREREIAIRLALGSGRARLVRQLVAEGLVLFAVGGAAGLVLARWAVGLVGGLELPTPVPLELELRAGGATTAFALLLALASGLAASLLPALRGSRPDLAPVLKDAGGTARAAGGRLRRAFVAGQIGLSLVLLVAAGLFLRSLQRAATLDTGFDAEGVSMVSLNLELDGYAEAEGRALADALLERVHALPGVSSAALATDLPMDLSLEESAYLPEGWEGEEQGMSSAFNAVSPGYFETLRIRLLAGRPFGAADGPDAPRVAVVSETFASRAWPGESAVGKRVRNAPRPGREEADLEWLTVVGVVDDVKNALVTEASSPMLYHPYAQAYSGGGRLVVRSTGGEVAGAIRREIRALDPDLSLSPVQPLEALTGLGLMPQRLAAGLAGVLGGLALLLSAMGVYGVVAFSVAQRTRELGIRMALGAERREILRLVLAGALRMAAPGLVAGGLLAFAAGGVLRGFLLGVAPADPLTFAAVAALLLGVVLLASLLPARRASRVDPMEAIGGRQ